MSFLSADLNSLVSFVLFFFNGKKSENDTIKGLILNFGYK